MKLLGCVTVQESRALPSRHQARNQGHGKKRSDASECESRSDRTAGAAHRSFVGKGCVVRSRRIAIQISANTAARPRINCADIHCFVELCVARSHLCASLAPRDPCDHPVRQWYRFSRPICVGRADRILLGSLYIERKNTAFEHMPKQHIYGVPKLRSGTVILIQINR